MMTRFFEQAFGLLVIASLLATIGLFAAVAFFESEGAGMGNLAVIAQN